MLPTYLKVTWRPTPLITYGFGHTVNILLTYALIHHKLVDYSILRSERNQAIEAEILKQ